ncbi:MAG: NADP-dependent isocitrate dehydrogenase [Alphaproteobacteria bacterium]|nr:MAG: NADP-dependent isocitrate dehydrogenase [Alphaproteobacteria bacterium]
MTHLNSMTHTISLIYGDGIGREVITATRRIIDAIGLNIIWEECIAGCEAFHKGIATGIPQETLDSINRNKTVLKGPLETPIGFGEKSANVTLRKCFETFANIRPVRNFPNVNTPYSDVPIDFVLIRENVEDLYAGIEYMTNAETAEGLKLITREGCEKIIRFAYEFARSEGRKTLHCATKANILKLTEGMMKHVFENVSKEYPDIESHHIIVDNCAHQLVRSPEKFDCLVMTNMNGDILSDLASGLVGGLGFAPGANIGSDIAIFEAVHGSAPKYAGKNMINPTAVLLSGTMMLRHIGEIHAATALENALFVTLEEGYLTRDVFQSGGGVTTSDFTDRIINNLGKSPVGAIARTYKTIDMRQIKPSITIPKDVTCTGIDVFIDSRLPVTEIGGILERACLGLPMHLSMIANRGIKVYPDVGMKPACNSSWQCRLLSLEGTLSDAFILQFLSGLSATLPWSTIKKLFVQGNTLFYTKVQGEA